MNAVLSFLIENLILFALLFAGVWLIKRIFAKQLSAAMHYLLWGVVMLRLLIPVGLPSELSPLNLLSRADAPAAVQTMPQEQSAESSRQLPAYSEPNKVTSGEPEPQTAVGVNSHTVDKTVSVHPFDIDWTLVILIVWAGGALGFGLWLAVGTTRLKKLAQGAEPPAHMLALFESCRKQMCIQKQIRLVLQAHLPVPAITGVRSPVLLLPASLLNEQDEEKLRHIFFHELSHYKRGDIIVTYLLNGLNALYWYNPLVWLAVRLVNRDMETACDATVLAHLGLEKRQSYIETVIEFGGNSHGRRFMPALCMNDGRMKMKSRIKGMFLRSKTKAAVKIPVVAAAFVLAFVCLTTACQPTPEEPVIVNKNADIVEDVLAAADEQSESALEEDKQVIAEQIKKVNGHLDMEITPGDSVTIKVNADIVAPEYDQIPLVRVRPENVSTEKFNKFADYLTGGLPLYVETWDNKNGNSRSKEEITAQLALIKSYLAKDDLPKNLRDAWERRADDLQQCFDTAISQADERPYDGTPIPAENNGSYSTITSLKCYMGRDVAAMLNLMQSYEGNETSAVFFNTDSVSAYNTFETYEGADASRIQMTYEEAKAKVMDFVHTVDGEDSNLVIYDSSIAYQIGTLPNYTMETSPQAYAFALARCYNGIAVKPVGYLFSFNETADYSKRVLPEMMYVQIDDSGIVQATWSGYTEYVEDVSNDVPLMDFDSIRDIFEDYCRYKFAWTYRNDALVGDTTPPVTLNVKKIELNVMVTPEKDNLDRYITVPVWDFIADMTLEGDGMSQDGFVDEGQKNVSILTINAINGSVIDRNMGY